MRDSSLLKPATVTIVAVAICALAILGCGGGSSSDGQAAGDDGGNNGSGTTATTTEKVPVVSGFVKRANAVCAKVEEELRDELGTYVKSKGVNEIGEGESPKGAKARQIEVVKKFALPALRKQQTGIEALDPPSKERAQVKEYTVALKKGIEEGEQQPELVYSSSVKAIQKSNGIALKLGLVSCGNR